MAVKCGYLIERTYERMYREFPEPAEADQIVYSVPRKSVPPWSITKRYRGISRDPLRAWYEEIRGAPGVDVPHEMDAALAMRELEEGGISEDDFIFDFDDACNVWRLLKDQTKWDLIWAADSAAGVSPPAESRLLGFEPTWFTGDHFSAVADCMCFPRWHGTDEEGRLFRAHYDSLNADALFNTETEAHEFLRYYRSFDWTESGDYLIAEVRSITVGATRG